MVKAPLNIDNRGYLSKMSQIGLADHEITEMKKKITLFSFLYIFSVYTGIM